MLAPKDEPLIRLVQHACEGNETALESLYYRYRIDIYKYLSAFVGKNDADDLLQETFIKAFTKITQLKNPSKFEAWLYQIARHVIHDYFKYQKRRIAPEIISERASSKSDFTEHIAQHELFWQALARVPIRLRDCLLLRVIGDFSSSEIASMLHLNPKSVDTYLSQARQIFRHEYNALTRR